MGLITNQVNVTRLINLLGFVLGVVVSWGLLLGDEQGRVNLLHLLFVYTFIPLASLIVSSASVLFGQGINLANLSSYFPFWSHLQKRAYLLQKNQAHAKWLFFYQSQLAAIFRRYPQ